MNRARTPRIVALIASIAFTSFMVKVVADYAYPAPVPVEIARAAAAPAR